jgi:pimeloyl-ACP methyl ester carboxylesterase
MDPLSIVAAGHRLEAGWIAPRDADAPAIVLLHEGVGCLSAWREWPEELASATGCGVLAYSRWGYAGSDPIDLPRPLTYMHDEGLTALPEVMDAAGIRDAILLGHSDGASIAIIHAGSARARPRVRGVVLLAPHVFCEDVSVAAIERTRDAFVNGDLRERLARRQGTNVDGAFWGWNRAWLDPGFRAWNIESFLAGIEVPVLVIQGEGDPYGTIAQVDAVTSGVRGAATRVILPECGHAPQKERPEETTAAVVAFVRGLPPVG